MSSVFNNRFLLNICRIKCEAISWKLLVLLLVHTQVCILTVLNVFSFTCLVGITFNISEPTFGGKHINFNWFYNILI